MTDTPEQWTTPGQKRGWRLVGGKRPEPRIKLQAIVLDLDQQTAPDQDVTTCADCGCAHSP